MSFSECNLFFILLISEMRISCLSPHSYLSPIMFTLIPRLWSFYVMKISYLSPLSYLSPIMFILIPKLWSFMLSPLCFIAEIFVFKRPYGESFWRKKFACCFKSVLTFLCFNFYLDLKFSNWSCHPGCYLQSFAYWCCPYFMLLFNRYNKEKNCLLRNRKFETEGNLRYNYVMLLNLSKYNYFFRRF